MDNEVKIDPLCLYDVLVGYIGQGISKEVIDKISDEYIKTFNLGDYL